MQVIRCGLCLRFQSKKLLRSNQSFCINREASITKIIHCRITSASSHRASAKVGMRTRNVLPPLFRPNDVWQVASSFRSEKPKHLPRATTLSDGIPQDHHVCDPSAGLDAFHRSLECLFSCTVPMNEAHQCFLRFLFASDYY